MYGTKRVVLGSLLAVAIAACGRPDFNTDLTPEGPPEVRTVAVSAEGLRTLINFVDTNEFPIYCASGVPEAKSFVHYCPEDGDDPGPGDIGPITDTMPIGFYVRVAFDELLDPSIETLNELDGVTYGSIVDGAVTVTCGGTAMATEGFYDPTGSHLTFPAGPAIFVAVTDTVATGSDCQVTIGDVVKDKSGESVPAGQRGPYDFSIALLAAAGTTPEADSTEVPVDTAMIVQFNNFIDETTLAGEVTLHDDTLDADVPIGVVVNTEDGTQVDISATAGVLGTSTDYTLTISGGTVADVEGGTLGDDVAFSFTTTAVGLPDAGAPDA